MPISFVSTLGIIGTDIVSAPDSDAPGSDGTGVDCFEDVPDRGGFDLLFDSFGVGVDLLLPGFDLSWLLVLSVLLLFETPFDTINNKIYVYYKYISYI